MFSHKSESKNDTKQFFTENQYFHNIEECFAVACRINNYDHIFISSRYSYIWDEATKKNFINYSS